MSRGIPAEIITVRNGISFKLDSHEYTPIPSQRGADLDLKTPGARHADAILFGEFVGDWELVRPYPTDPFHDEIDPALLAVLVKRSERYKTALAARKFIREHDLHEEPGPVGLRALFRSLGGTMIQPGGLSDRDAERYPSRTARIHGPGDITLFLREGEDQARRNELLALTIAAWALDEAYESDYHVGYRDLQLGDARGTHPKAHFFASMMLVPQQSAAAAVDIEAAEEIGAELRVDPATVQDAHQLWNEITNPEQPRI